MKKISKLILCFFIASFTLVGCSDMLDVDSTRAVTDSEYDLKSPGDSIYSMFGIFSRLQKLADSYVLLGELRGDLMAVTESSDIYLREINNFEISDKNIYVNRKDYYDLINNCNYVLQKLDTTVFDNGEKLKLRQYAAVKTIRAWTYMQMALNFKTVKYFTAPILTVADAEKTYEEYDLKQLADVLIADLEPLKTVPNPGQHNFDTYDSRYYYFPARFVLGDLYLWRASLQEDGSADYLRAASEYRDLMYNNKIIIDKANTSYWVVVNNTISNSGYVNWLNAFFTTSGEVITSIACPTEYGQTYQLDTLNNQNKISPSSIAINNWDTQTYYLNPASNSQGDMRKYGSIWFKEVSVKPTSNNSYSGMTGTQTYIYKYKMYNQNVIVYRSSLLYLRYAEAVNRLNKPNLAFAVLKYGLNSTNMINTKIIPAKEKETPLPTYMSFTDSRFMNNVGIRMRGLGNMDQDTAFFKMQYKPSMKDSVLYVEDLIQQELALETAFEGNRFHDLMRFALRRKDASYLAKKVAAKHTENQSAIETKLMDTDNWYIKK